jgi:hypothetical protein
MSIVSHKKATFWWLVKNLLALGADDGEISLISGGFVTVEHDHVHRTVSWEIFETFMTTPLFAFYDAVTHLRWYTIHNVPLVHHYGTPPRMELF